jgi:uncharacterized protein HemX
MAQEDDGQVSPQLQESRGLGPLIGLLAVMLLLALGAGGWLLSQRHAAAVLSMGMSRIGAALEAELREGRLAARAEQEPQARRAALDALQRRMGPKIADYRQSCAALMERRVLMPAEARAEIVTIARRVDALFAGLKAPEEGSLTEPVGSPESEPGGR